MSNAKKYIELLDFSISVQSSSNGIRSRSIITPISIGTGLLDGRVDEAKRMTLEAAQIQARLTNADDSVKDKINSVFLNASSGFSKLQNDGQNALLTRDEEIGLEAITIADGTRPSQRMRHNRLDLSDPRLGGWKQVSSENIEEISKAAEAVGRIDLDGHHRGTGFVVSEDLILTNRHVLQSVATQLYSGKWQLDDGATINFGEFPRSERDFKISEVVDAGLDVIDPQNISFEKNDYAILKVDLASGSNYPNPISLEPSIASISEDKFIYVIGYPGRPSPGYEDDDILREIFDLKFGVKRFSPGIIDAELEDIYSGDVRSVFGYDCTTLGGSSGSPILAFSRDQNKAIGLHFSGEKRFRNFAHSTGALRNKWKKSLDY